MAEVNKRQAFIIQGAAILPNDSGTAPGQWVEESGGVVMLLPGPPHELKAMFEQQCLPRLARIVPKQAIRTLHMRVTGMSESDLDQTIAPVYTKYTNPVTTILAANGDLQIHLRARCANVAEADARDEYNEADEASYQSQPPVIPHPYSTPGRQGSTPLVRLAQLFFCSVES